MAAKKSEVLAIVNQKGGVGKSTTAVNLSACLAEQNYRTLLIDLDPQANTTSGLGLQSNGSGCIYSCLLDSNDISKIVQKTEIENLFVAAATIQLAGAEIELVSALSRETRLKKALENVETDYDYIIIDCPPSLGLLTINALTAADKLVIPVQCEYYALEGLSKLLESINLVKENLNPQLGIKGVVLTMHDKRTKLSTEVKNEVQNYFKEQAFSTIIPRSVRLSEAPSFGQPIILYDSASKGAQAYRDLAKEVINNG